MDDFENNVKFGIFESYSHYFGPHSIGCVFPLNKAEMVAITMKEMILFEGNEIKARAKYNFCCGCYIPEATLIVANTYRGSELFAMPANDFGNPILTNFPTDQIGIYHMIYSPKSHVILTIGTGIKVWDISWVDLGRKMLTTDSKVIITYRSTFAPTYDSPMLNPPAFDYETERLYLPTPEGIRGFSLDGFPCDLVTRLPADTNTIYSFCAHNGKVITSDPVNGVCVWKKGGEIEKRISTLGPTILSIGFVDSQNFLYLNASGSLFLVNLKTTRPFHCYDSPQMPTRLSITTLYGRPHITFCMRSVFQLLRIVLPWKVWNLNIARPKTIIRVPKFDYSARMITQTSNSFIKLYSPKNRQQLVSTTPRETISQMTFFYDTGTFIEYLFDNISLSYVEKPIRTAPGEPRDYLFVTFDNGVVTNYNMGCVPCTELWSSKMNALCVEMIKSPITNDWMYAIGRSDGGISFLDYFTFKEIRTVSVCKEKIVGMLYHYHSDTIIFVLEKKLQLLDLKTNQIIDSIPYRFTEIYTIHANIIYLGGKEGQIERYEIVNRRLTEGKSDIEPRPHKERITSFSFGRKYYLTSSIDSTFMLWNYEHDKITLVTVPFPIYSISFLGPKRQILLGMENEVMIMDPTVLFGDEIDPEIEEIDNYDRKTDCLDPELLAMEAIKKEQEKKNFLNQLFIMPEVKQQRNSFKKALRKYQAEQARLLEKGQRLYERDGGTVEASAEDRSKQLNEMNNFLNEQNGPSKSPTNSPSKNQQPSEQNNENDAKAQNQDQNQKAEPSKEDEPKSPKKVKRKKVKKENNGEANDEKGKADPDKALDLLNQMNPNNNNKDSKKSTGKKPEVDISKMNFAATSENNKNQGDKPQSSQKSSSPKKESTKNDDDENADDENNDNNDEENSEKKGSKSKSKSSPSKQTEKATKDKEKSKQNEKSKDKDKSKDKENSKDKEKSKEKDKQNEKEKKPTTKTKENTDNKKADKPQNKQQQQPTAQKQKPQAGPPPPKPQQETKNNNSNYNKIPPKKQETKPNNGPSNTTTTNNNATNNTKTAPKSDTTTASKINSPISTTNNSNDASNKNNNNEIKNNTINNNNGSAKNLNNNDTSKGDNSNNNNNISSNNAAIKQPSSDTKNNNSIINDTKKAADSSGIQNKDNNNNNKDSISNSASAAASTTDPPIPAVVDENGQVLMQLSINSEGKVVNENGDVLDNVYVDKDGNFVNKDGEYLNEKGEPTDKSNKVKYASIASQYDYMTEDGKQIPGSEIDKEIQKEMAMEAEMDQVKSDRAKEQIKNFHEAYEIKPTEDLTKQTEEGQETTDGDQQNHQHQKSNDEGQEEQQTENDGEIEGEKLNGSNDKPIKLIESKQEFSRPSTPPPIRPYNSNIDSNPQLSNTYNNAATDDDNVMKFETPPTRRSCRTPPLKRKRKIWTKPDDNLPPPNFVLDPEAVLAMFGRGHTELLPLIERIRRDYVAYQVHIAPLPIVVKQGKTFRVMRPAFDCSGSNSNVRFLMFPENSIDDNNNNNNRSYSNFNSASYQNNNYTNFRASTMTFKPKVYKAVSKSKVEDNDTQNDDINNNTKPIKIPIITLDPLNPNNEKPKKNKKNNTANFYKFDIDDEPDNAVSFGPVSPKPPSDSSPFTFSPHRKFDISNRNQSNENQKNSQIKPLNMPNSARRNTNSDDDDDNDGIKHVIFNHPKSARRQRSPLQDLQLTTKTDEDSDSKDEDLIKSPRNLHNSSINNVISSEDNDNDNDNDSYHPIAEPSILRPATIRDYTFLLDPDSVSTSSSMSTTLRDMFPMTTKGPQVNENQVTNKVVYKGGGYLIGSPGLSRILPTDFSRSYSMKLTRPSVKRKNTPNLNRKRNALNNSITQSVKEV